VAPAGNDERVISAQMIECAAEALRGIQNEVSPP
jgi:hypothetical protein